MVKSSAGNFLVTTQWSILAALEGELLDPNLKRNYIWGESWQIKNSPSDPFLEHMLILS